MLGRHPQRDISRRGIIVEKTGCSGLVSLFSVAGRCRRQRGEIRGQPERPVEELEKNDSENRITFPVCD